MKSNLKLLSVAIAGFFLIVSCTKTKEEKNDDLPAIKEVTHITRDFTKGIMTIDYTDGTQSITKIPIDSTSSTSDKGLSSGRIGEGTWSEFVYPETIQPTPEYQMEYFPADIYTFADYGVIPAGPKVWTAPHVTLLKVDGLIMQYSNPWVEITKNKSASYPYRSWAVNRTAAVFGLIFTPGLTNVSVSICRWDYYINYYFTYSPYSPPKTKQVSYSDIRTVI